MAFLILKARLSKGPLPLGVSGITSVRQGKVFDIEISAEDSSQAKQNLKTACEKLLANTVIENYSIEI